MTHNVGIQATTPDRPHIQFNGKRNAFPECIVLLFYVFSWPKSAQIISFPATGSQKTQELAPYFVSLLLGTTRCAYSGNCCRFVHYLYWWRRRSFLRHLNNYKVLHKKYMVLNVYGDCSYTQIAEIKVELNVLFNYTNHR